MKESSTRLRALAAMVWKEWRERFLSACVVALLFVVVLGATAYANFRDAASMSEQDLRNIGNFWDFAQTVLAIGTPLFALALGFVQMNGEGKSDGWAFLIHRPVTRRFLFWGKALAGLSLCAFVVFFAYGLFTVLAAFNVRTPAPFSWRMLWFGWVVVALCVPPYFAGALMALRMRSWVGSRALPLLGVLFCLMFAAGTQSWQRVLLYLACAVVVGVAAQGAFESERLRRQNRWAQVALSSTLLAGLTMICFLVASALLISDSIRSGDQRAGSYRQYVVTQGGQIAVSRTEISAAGGMNQQTLTDLQGRALVKNALIINPKDLDRKQYESLTFSPLVSYDRNPAAPLPAHYDSYFVFLGTWAEVRSKNAFDVSWWFDGLSRRIVGYRANPKRVYGYIGVNGFFKNARDCQPFDETPLPGPYAYPAVMEFPHSIYALNWRAKSVRKIYETQEEIVSSSFSSTASDANFNWSSGRIVTRQSLVFVSPQGESRFVALPDLQQFSVLLAQSRNGHFWLQFVSRGDPEASITFVELAADGAVLRKSVLPPLASAAGVDWPSARLSIALMPAVVTRWNVNETRRNFLFSSNPSSEKATRDGLVFSFFLSSLCAFFAWRRATRYAFTSSTRLGWTVGVFLLGPLGFLLMHSLFDWPALETCPSCGKKRVVTREECEHCSQTFGAPAPDGTEIVESETREMAPLRLAS